MESENLTKGLSCLMAYLDTEELRKVLEELVNIHYEFYDCLFYVNDGNFFEEFFGSEELAAKAMKSVGYKEDKPYVMFTANNRLVSLTEREISSKGYLEKIEKTFLKIIKSLCSEGRIDIIKDIEDLYKTKLLEVGF